MRPTRRVSLFSAAQAQLFKIAGAASAAPAPTEDFRNSRRVERFMFNKVVSFIIRYFQFAALSNVIVACGHGIASPNLGGAFQHRTGSNG
jgi:hypothetical protein